jgi:pyruvate dehydrogenase E2 component (dihydrolipoamide acetyltransferase)
MVDVKLPQLGETVTEGTITKFFKKVGDAVALDEALFEVSTDKVDTEVPSPTGGVLLEILVGEGDTVDVGTIVARVGDAGDSAGTAPEAAPAEPPAAETAAAPTPAPAAAPAPAPAAPAAAPSAPAPAVAAAPAAAPAPAAPASGTEGLVLSPIVRRLISEHGLDASTIPATGLGGRLTRSDVEKVIETQARTGASAAAAPAPAPAAPETAPARAAAPTPTAPASAPRVVAPPVLGPAGGDTIEKLNNIRRRTAEHMVMSKATSPHVLTAIEVDYENVERVRKTQRESWKASEGFSLTYLPFITRALVAALRDYPRMNATVGEGELIVHNYVNLGIAVDLDFEGLLAPVIQGTDQLRLRAIAREIHDLANRARTKKLTADEIMGGTITITNAGQYGTMMQFPIINQPQVAILSTDGISRKPVVVTDEYGNESIAIHSVGVLALAWDHRAVDGAYAAAFLSRLREIIQTTDWAAELA